MDLGLKQIGIVHSELKEPKNAPKQESENAPEAMIEIFSDYSEGMKDISPGDEIILFTWFHLSKRNVLSTHPRNDSNAPITGVFSTRSPERPNPIGMHIVKVISEINNNTFRVSALEAVDGTPIIDIKPVLK